MPLVRKSVIVPHSCATMFSLVDDVEAYPRFLPWCAAAQVVSRTPEVTLARIAIDYRGMRSQFSTRNLKREPHEMELGLVEGPFQRLAGRWSFAALGQSGCRVELALDYELASAAIQALSGPVFAHIAQTLVDSFVRRAEALAAGGPP